ncbi:methyl-accepting chemotaxis protein [Natronobiforma cellulositropha]|uniref:methyl-accepting chemotaxis protein n=1 Tax=Natronobiforma cellulositropha TaxID=1679076 RepID=UPI0021D61269|nr:methyl-accepting chemotaxis protein [Natronobiforma cellulositropha]
MATDNIGNGFGRVVPRFIRDRYLAKFVAIVLVVVLIIASVGFVGYTEATESVEESTDDHLTSTVTMQADSISTWVDEKRQQSVMISDTEQVMSGDVREIQMYIDRHWGTFNVRGVHYVDTSENAIVASSSSSAIGESLADIDDPWADADALDGIDSHDDVLVSDRAFHDSLLEDDVVTFTSPVLAWDDRYVVVVAGIESHVDTLHQPLLEQSTTIINEDGDPVLSGAEEADEERHEIAFGETDVSALTEAHITRGDNFVYAMAPVDGTGWTAVSTVPIANADAVSDTVAQSLLVIVGVSLISLLGMAVVLGRHTVTPLTTLRSRVKQMEEGDLDVDLRTSRTDEIGQLYGGFDTMRISLRQRITEVQEAQADAEAARDEAERMNRHLEAKADEYNGVIDEWADGDLTRRLDPTSENVAMTEIARDLNSMVADLEIALHHVKGFANQTAVASEQVTASTEEVRAASQQVTDSIQEISAGSERQNLKLLSTADEMNSLSATTEEITSLSTQVATLAERTAETGQEGREAAQEAIDAMDEIEAGSTHAVEEIRRLEEEEVAQIDELIASIADIAKETNMLALNANIEASRSTGGDDNDGFGVVAHEIKELSQDAKRTADEIETRLEAIREQTRRSASEVEQTSSLIDEANRRVQKTVAGLEQIASYAEETNTGVQEITSVTEAQANTTEEIVSQVEEVTAISQETTAEAETVASAAEEQTAGLIETSRSIESLSRRATELSDALDRFDTDVTTGPDDQDELEVL